MFEKLLCDRVYGIYVMATQSLCCFTDFAITIPPPSYIAYKNKLRVDINVISHTLLSQSKVHTLLYLEQRGVSPFPV